jgi:membrane-bound lytic murein transglycosylase A
VFWGAGAEAFQLAGRMNSPGDWYLLLPRHRSGEFALLDSPNMKAGR